MKKIPSLFQRNYDTDKLVRNEVVPGSEWVLNGEGVATAKWDGTSCLIQDGILYKRYDAKNGKTPPPDFIPAQEADPVTGHWPGWVPAHPMQDKYHFEAFMAQHYEDGTYELCGPKINGNPERLDKHQLLAHGKYIMVDFPRTYDQIKDALENTDIEGIVWHHPDGRMVKIKKKDFGFKRK